MQLSDRRICNVDEMLLVGDVDLGDISDTTLQSTASKLRLQLITDRFTSRTKFQ